MNQSEKRRKSAIEQAMHSEKKEQVEQAIEQLNKLISDTESDLELLHARGRLFEKQQQWSKAINDYLTILTIDKNDKESQTRLETLKTILKYNNLNIYSSTNTHYDPWFE